MATIHVYPVNDLIQHNTDSDECLCGPTIGAVIADDGSCGWRVTHNSMDGREFSEPGYTGPPMAMERR